MHLYRTTSRLFQLLTLSLLALMLAACGGGGGDGTSGMMPDTVVEQPQPEPDPEPTPEPEPEPEAQLLPFPLPRNPTVTAFGGLPQSAADVRQAPVYHGANEAPFHRYEDTPLFVGVDQGTDHIGSLELIGERGDFDIRHGELNDGAGLVLVREYLGQLMRSNEVYRHKVAPVVKFVGEPTDSKHINRTLNAIRLVNAALPVQWRIRVPSVAIGNSLGSFTSNGEGYDPSGNEEPGTIYVEFVDGMSVGGKAWTQVNNANGEWGIDHAYIRLNTAAQLGGEVEGLAANLVVHEFLHALFGTRHVSSDLPSIMDSSGGAYVLNQQPLSILPSLDREALRVLYSRLDNLDSPADFGTWASTSTHLHANGQHAAFGVAMRNGYAEPWAYGYLPETGLVDNTTLTGTATWSGVLLGFTPDAAPVAGDAALSVDLDTLDGRADFTNLESWTTGQAPGEAGSGTTWHDGDLGYSIVVNGNTFKQTGGDDGILTGAFFGESHEGMGGTLERDDLTAAFGGKR